MLHPVVITLAHHPRDRRSVEAAERIVAHFDRFGMERAGVQMRVPVRLRSEPLRPDGTLRPLDLCAPLDVIVVLHSAAMDEQPGAWRTLLAPLADPVPAPGQRAPVLLVVPMEEGLGTLSPLPQVQQVRWFAWADLDDAARARRLMIHVVNATRRALNGLGPDRREPIFVSHAKADAREAAERVVAHISDPRNGLKLGAFYDALDLESGEDWVEGLRDRAQAGSLLALVSDAYDGRPWCNQEILWAKEARRAILMVDVGRRRTGRSFPYAGNAPVIADPLVDGPGIETALLELLSEALRCDLFAEVARTLGHGPFVYLPRPPELCDLVYCAETPPEATIVYPDPPLSALESDLLRRLFGERRFVSLTELA